VPVVTLLCVQVGLQNLHLCAVVLLDRVILAEDRRAVNTWVVVCECVVEVRSLALYLAFV
jgi:hypothetical protein